MWNNKIGKTEDAVTCLCCGLSCDDLRLEVNKDHLKLLDNGCALARSHFDLTFDTLNEHAKIKGVQASLEEALDYGVELLQRAHNPLFAGLATDVNGMRATLGLADRCGATLDHLNGDALFRNVRVMQDNGWITTTFTEVRNRADLIILVGNLWIEHFPRLIERILHPSESLFSAPDDRRFVLLGAWDDTNLPDGLEALTPSVIPVQLEQLSDTAGMLRGLIAGRPVNAQAVGKILGDKLQELSGMLKAANYSVVIWNADELDFPHAELTIQGLVNLVKDLNITTRSAALPLAGTQADITSNQVCTWQLGYPLRTGLQRGYPEHEPILNRYQDLLKRKEADLLLWISSLSPRARPPANDSPTIVLSHPGMTFDNTPDLYIPVGIPGVDHHGHWYRGDSACPMPLGQLRDSTLPAVSQVMDSLNDKLQHSAGQ
ncbi:MAG: formylmethanofuran dehydrogenase subunit B [Gammaproteobacteria bacterium]|nr:formylmethanofuran dehydrogenase subunit B [Gammaproteobacteria bacterium]